MGRKVQRYSKYPYCWNSPMSEVRERLRAIVEGGGWCIEGWSCVYSALWLHAVGYGCMYYNIILFYYIYIRY